MPSHDPFSPDSGVAPPSDDDASVVEPEAPEPPQTDPDAPSDDDDGDGDTDPETPAEDDAEEEELEREEQTELNVRVGTASEVLDWVHEEGPEHVKARAAAALEVEQSSLEPRKGLSHDLEKLLSDDAES